MFILIESSEDLIFLNKELLKCPYLGIDSEFRRTNKDNMKLALLQVNDSTEIYLIDCLKIREPNTICSFLSSPDVTKIFHSCKEDNEAIYSWTNQKVHNIYDTQIANALLGGSFSLSYQDLVKEKFGLKVSKDETRTNWLRRPLSESQLNYAASDVFFLIDLYKQQMEKLIEENKLSWLEEELNDPPPSDGFEEVNSETKFKITKKEEKEILGEFDLMIKDFSRAKNINPTLFFSKQNQKNLLRNTLALGVNNALERITKWRSNLIQVSYSRLMKKFGVI